MCTRNPTHDTGMKGGAQLWMLLRRVSLITDAKRKLKDSLHPKTRDPARAEIERRIDGADVTKRDTREEEISLPQMREENAMLQIPSFKKVDPSASHGGSTSRRKRLPQELVREKRAQLCMWKNPAKWLSQWKRKPTCSRM